MRRIPQEGKCKREIDAIVYMVHFIFKKMADGEYLKYR
jgi:hypothetical protein